MVELIWFPICAFDGIFIAFKLLVHAYYKNVAYLVFQCDGGF